MKLSDLLGPIMERQKNFEQIINIVKCSQAEKIEKETIQPLIRHEIEGIYNNALERILDDNIELVVDDLLLKIGSDILREERLKKKKEKEEIQRKMKIREEKERELMEKDQKRRKVAEMIRKNKIEENESQGLNFLSRLNQILIFISIINYRGGGYKVIQMGGYKVRQVGGYKVSLSLDFRMWGFIRSNRYFFVAANACL